MATKHMTGGDLLRIRKLMAAGMKTVAEIQQTVDLHPSRIQEVLDVGLPKAPKVVKLTAAQKAKAKAAKKAKDDAAAAAADVNPVS